MNIRSNIFAILVSLLFIVTPVYVINAQVKLPRLISDGMVIQRDDSLKIWGWASDKEDISVVFKGEEYTTRADRNGNWMVQLPEFEAGGPYDMLIRGTNEITISNILIGDVWICSGQSNMELTMQRVKTLYQEEIDQADFPNIRYFEVPNAYHFKAPLDDLDDGEWTETTPENILKFSAVAYFFGREIHDAYEVPIGLINASVGGSPAEAWMSENSLKKFPRYYRELRKFKNEELIQNTDSSDRERKEAWYTELNQNDRGYESKPWSDLDLRTYGWPSMRIPGYWTYDKLGSMNGVVWFRQDVKIMKNVTGRSAKLLLGRIVDSDSVFVNGTFIGTTGDQYSPREYDIDSGILFTGVNSIAIRVINERGNGGFVEDKPYQLIVDKDTFDLTGYWKYELGKGMEPLASQTIFERKPGGLYNAMLAPLLNYRMKGVIWYQGESNVKDPIQYDRLFPTLIKDWRKQWDLGDFPFLYVQLANYKKATKDPEDSDWARLREAQFKALSLPNTGMAVAIDLGEWNDIHPLNKQDVGKRLARAAKVVAYQDSILHTGPVYTHAEIVHNRIILSFNLFGSELIAKNDDVLQGFTIAGRDRVFVRARARIEKNKVIVWSETVDQPTAARYAWADNPEGANLYNKEGLPASPFRTDRRD